MRMFVCCAWIVSRAHSLALSGTPVSAITQSQLRMLSYFVIWPGTWATMNNRDILPMPGTVPLHICVACYLFSSITCCCTLFISLFFSHRVDSVRIFPSGRHLIVLQQQLLVINLPTGLQTKQWVLHQSTRWALKDTKQSQAMSVAHRVKPAFQTSTSPNHIWHF